MNEELDYAEMLEIPVNTVNVVKKKSIFKRKTRQTEPEFPQDDLKEQVLESVNERVGAYVISEDVSDPPKPEKKGFKAFFRRNKSENTQSEANTGVKDKSGVILLGEAIAVGVIALAIFLTNVFVPDTVINTFLSSFSSKTENEPAYTEFKLAPVVSEFSDAEVYVSDSGVLAFTAEGSVYPICKGTVSKVYEDEGKYAVEIAHTSTFKSVVTGLTDVYSAEGTAVRSNIPVGYSDGNSEVRVSMYDNGKLLDCYMLSDEVPVWKS